MEPLRGSDTGLARHLERLSLYVLLVVVALRPLIGETYHTAQTSLSAALSEVTGPMPVRTLAIDATIVAAALLWLVARARGNPGRYRHCGIEWGAVLVALGAALGLIFKGGQMITAFVLSVIPGAASIIMVLMGKKMIENLHSSDDGGMIAVWGGNGVLLIAVIVIYYGLSRK